MISTLLQKTSNNKILKDLSVLERAPEFIKEMDQTRIVELLESTGND